MDSKKLCTILPQENAEIIAIRRHLHRHPETSWHETQTTAYIREKLAEIDGVQLLQSNLPTGVHARIDGNAPGKCVALRADIDALDVVEAWDGECKSEVPGKGHLCGHDFHTSSLIGAAKILARTRTQWNGKVVLVFQPAEETTNGAREVLKTGVLEREGVQAIFGLHNRPEVETGRVVVHQGSLMAAKINFQVVVHGVGGHGSMPHKCIDPIVCAAGIVQNVLTIPARNVDPMKSLVLSICSIHGGTPANLIVDTVEMTGSMRYHDPEVGKCALERLKTVVRATADVFGCRADFAIVEQVPAVINDAGLLPVARRAAACALGPDAIVDSECAMATEDFADYMQAVPGFFYWLGNRKPGDTCYAWHNDHFHVDENALRYGCQLLAASAIEFLSEA